LLKKEIKIKNKHIIIIKKANSKTLKDMF